MVEVLFSCTAYFGFPKEDKFTKTMNAIGSIVDKHKDAEPEALNRVQSWIVINEYHPDDTDEKRKHWTDALQTRFPFINVVHKVSPKDEGQARSMNIIFDILKSIQPKYWLHWEESWFASSPFLQKTLHIMDTQPQITQLQMTKLKGTTSWMDLDKSRRACRDGYCIIAPLPPDSKEKELAYDNPYNYQYEWGHRWPLYSLLPSLNRVEHYGFAFKKGFNTDPVLWPFKFEWEFARRWLKAGSVKAVLDDGPVIRSDAHVSTYAIAKPSASSNKTTITASGLSSGAIAGIAVACAMVIVVVIVLAVLFGCKRRVK